MNEGLPTSMLLLHLAATLYMVGLIWFVQIVHYPLLANVGADEFSSYERSHTSKTTWVVGPPMLVEAATAVLLFWLRPIGLPSWQLWMGVSLLLVIWASTVALQVPCHQALSNGFDATVHRRLVSTNWIRTVAWSLRGVAVLLMAWTTWWSN
ncbi:hypothetical protein [Lignipirellula cremea]|uniref:hypothetical protein n=1 Tax=Lignipirellula cremea TaxID=2528010 RepID=UPI0011A07E69|nr:hypothetical protein [Lignipirellula cremea]